MVVQAKVTVDEMYRRNEFVGLRVVTVLQVFPVNALFAWWTQIFVAVSTVDLFGNPPCLKGTASVSQ
jgi:hypothetical protein